MKKCSKCKCDLLETRKHSYCKDCAREYHLNHRKDRSDYYKQYDIKRYQNETYRKNKIEKVKEWRNKNKEQADDTTKKWNEENKERVKKNKLTWKQKEYQENPKYKLACVLRARFHQALAKALVNKQNSIMELIGCSIDHLKEHIEKQFVEGMNWENWSFYGWHIDHIRPIASFDLSDPAQVKECFHYSNLQPLWAKDNLSKGDKFISD